MYGANKSILFTGITTSLLFVAYQLAADPKEEEIQKIFNEIFDVLKTEAERRQKFILDTFGNATFKTGDEKVKEALQEYDKFYKKGDNAVELNEKIAAAGLPSTDFGPEHSASMNNYNNLFLIATDFLARHPDPRSHNFKTLKERCAQLVKPAEAYFNLKEGRLHPILLEA